MLNSGDITIEERHKQASDMIRPNLYLEWMAKYTLGRHRRTIPNKKIEEFIVIYSKFVVKVYADLSNTYSKEKAVVKKIKKIDNDMFLVNMEILKKNSIVPIKVNYLVHKKTDRNQKNIFLVGDIITEGISILNSQQSEFNSILSNQGIEVLINDLTTKANRPIGTNNKKKARF
jgi:phospholipid transport system substrate-binding protein